MSSRHPSTGPIGATVLGYPRIGRNRQLKHALEKFWSGEDSGTDLNTTAAEVRRDALLSMAAAGLDTVPVNTFSWYDQMLDTAVLVGAVPARFGDVSGSHQLAGFDADRYFAMARGVAQTPPLEITKWFDTNYHYLVPEISPDTVLTLHPDKPLTEYAEAVELGIPARPVVIGPWTFLRLAKAASGAPDGFDPIRKLGELTEVYADLLAELAAVGVDWVQIDEPALVHGLDAAEVEKVREVYERLCAVQQRPAILVATYFGSPVEALPALCTTSVEAVGLDLTRGPDVAEVAGTPGLRGKTLVLGAVDGRNIWRTDLRATQAVLQEWQGTGATLAISTSCSLLHVPYDVSVETDLDKALRANLAFADQKLHEVAALWQALEGNSEAHSAAFAECGAALAGRDSIPGLHRVQVAARLAGIEESQRQREPRVERDLAQAERLHLPLLPTTTIGSFPQTAAVRRARAGRRSGRITDQEYTADMRREIEHVVRLQEDLGLDVLVHGEPERNDMVQYFAEQLDGYASTLKGWVQSYGSRCVRPPILYGDIDRPQPMTVEWARYAQTLTDRPVKGMLTGPVTMLAWSFVREDQAPSVTADQVALALRDEVADLEAAGIVIIQVDEPALRETLPLREAQQKAYLDWAVAAFRLATSGVSVSTQVHTHLCYSEFGEIIEAIDGLGADVTSIEAARSGMELLSTVAEHGFTGSLGPGVYDIHSPRVPRETEISHLLTKALRALPASKLWINPDCGLKTRSYTEVEPALRNMVAATTSIRAELLH